MLILLNPYSGGGRALEKWNRIQDEVNHRYDDPALRIVEETERWDHLIQQSLAEGERNFVAAGGDGTVNILLNALLTSTTLSQKGEITLGAIGLGSSNDFHKPFGSTEQIGGIPCRLNWQGATSRDIGCLSYRDNDSIRSKYFISNASIGITANANYFFNHPDRVLSHLKKHFVNGAIYYAALYSIVKHRNIAVTIGSGINHGEPVRLSNLAIIKNPHFSGSMRYAVLPDYQNKEFEIFSCHDMHRSDLVRLLYHCAHGGTNSLPNINSWKGDSLSVRAATDFAVEYDGEIIRTTTCRFSIFPTSIKVCS